MLMKFKRPSWMLISFTTVILLLVGLRAFTLAGLWVAEGDRLGKADLIICLNGSERIKKTAELYHKGLAPKILLTAGKDKKDLTQLGIPEMCVTLAEWPMTTYQEALAVASMDHLSQIHSAIVVTDPYHLKRVRWTFRHVLNDSPVKLYFISSDLPWNGKDWWREKQSRILVALEISKMGYYRLVHGLMGLDDDPSWTITLKQRYEKLLIKCLS